MLFETRDPPVATRTNNADAELFPKKRRCDARYNVREMYV
jgi:hypothetical protein